MFPWAQPHMLLTAGKGLPKIWANSFVHWCWWRREWAPHEFLVDIKSLSAENRGWPTAGNNGKHWFAMREFPGGGIFRKVFRKYCPQKYRCFSVNSVICKIYIWVLQYFQCEHVHVYDPEYFKCELSSFWLTQGIDICKSLLALGVFLMACINSRCPFMNLKFKKNPLPFNDISIYSELLFKILN